MLLNFFSESEECGIPITNFIGGYFLFQTVWIVFDLYRIRRQLPLILYHKYVSWGVKSIREGMFVAYLIYGNIIFYSKQNQCKQKDYPNYLMMLFLICIGYIYFFIVGIISVFVIITLYIEVSTRVDRHRRKHKYHRVLKKLKKVKYSAQGGTISSECVICWADFVERDDVTVMSCDERHHFHKGCIESWVK